MLKSNGPVKYSPGERRLFELLSQNGQIATTELAKKYYKHDAPENAQKVVVGALRSLGRKVLKNKEPFWIRNTKQQGPHPMQFWVEPRGKSGK